jgi:hypothetical protein
MAQDMGLITDTWMTNPYMFDPTQKSNQFSNYNNAALPWPPSYNTGAGGPVNAATGQPIQSFQQWQQQNPGGMSINSTPAQPAAAPQGSDTFNRAAQMAYLTGNNAYLSAMGYGPGGSVTPGSQAAQYGMGAQTPQAAPQASGPPNNWQAAINALSNPGKVTTQGANVPQVQGYQPAGGVNQAFLQQAGAGAGMNQGFLSALRGIQNRPQQ